MRRLLANEDGQDELLRPLRILASRSIGPEATFPGARPVLFRTGMMQRPVLRPNIAFVKRSPPVFHPGSRSGWQLSQV
jgi:hypothetical protein